MYRFVAVLVLGATASGSLQAQCPESDQCGSCRIEFDTLAILGTLDGPGALPGPPLQVHADSQGRLWLAFSNNRRLLPLAFDRNGAFQLEFGSVGEARRSGRLRLADVGGMEPEGSTAPPLTFSVEIEADDLVEFGHPLGSGEINVAPVLGARTVLRARGGACMVWT